MNRNKYLTINKMSFENNNTFKVNGRAFQSK